MEGHGKGGIALEERIQKILSRHGIASRRQAEAMIAAGRVAVNGVAAHLGDTANAEQDEITLDGHPISQAPPKCYLMLHKPRGYVTTLSDEKGRKNVSQLVADLGQRVYPVGRLDLDSEGLLLMTNDGALANRLMHPSGGIEKCYHVTVRNFNEACLPVLRKPIEIDGRYTHPARVRCLWQREDRACLEFWLSDGRNRQIRRLCEAAGVEVLRLLRIQEGTLRLGKLPPGAWRPLTLEELRDLERTLQWKFLKDL